MGARSAWPNGTRGASPSLESIGRVDALAYGPHGVLRIDGKVHFVRGVVPGDEVEVTVREDRGSYAYADLVRVLTPGPARRAAPCEYLPRCGGCPWQHIDYAEQTRAKERNLRELLIRVGGIADPPVEPIATAERELGYRRRLSMRVERGRLGFAAAASHDLVPVERCLLAAPALDGAIEIAQAWVATLATAVKRLEIAATGEGDRFVLVAQADGPFARSDAARARALLEREPRVAGAVVRGRGFRESFGDERISVPLVDGDDMQLSAADFSQVGDASNALLLRGVLELAGIAPAQEVADLYAGAGNLTLPLARRAGGVLAVERSASSIAALRDNTRRLGIANVEAIAGSVARVLEAQIDRGRRIDAAVLDPPRSGAADALAALVRLGPARIVYVSCNPATLARDVRSLAPHYRLVVARPIDFFPQTYHLETVALLQRT